MNRTPSLRTTRLYPVGLLHSRISKVFACSLLLIVCSGCGMARQGIAAPNTLAPALPVKPVIFPASGTYKPGQTISIADATLGSAVFYTTDGTTPNAKSTPYTGPIVLQTETVRAIAIKGNQSSIEASATYKVSIPVSISITPRIAVLKSTSTQMFHATVAGTTNTAVTWKLSPAVGSISSAGLYTPPATLSSAQNLVVTATSVADPSVTASAALDVLATPILASIHVTIAQADKTIAAGTPRQLIATGTYSDGSNLDLTNTVQWSQSDPTLGMVNPQGLLASAAPGKLVVSAASGSVTGSVTVPVGAPVVTAIKIFPAAATVLSGQAIQLQATASMSDGTQKIVTNSVQWTPTSVTEGVISNSPGSKGLMTAQTSGTVQYAATIGQVSGGAVVSILPARTGTHTITIAPGTYTLTSTIYLANDANTTFDMRGATFVPGAPGVVPFSVAGNNQATTNVHLLGGHFLKNQNGVGFTSFLSGYVSDINPVNGLDIEVEEIAGTTGRAIEIVNCPVVTSSNYKAVNNVHIHNSHIHDTGGESIYMNYGTNIEIDHIQSASPSLAGIGSTFQPVNFLVGGEGISIHDNDLSGTPPWNQTPFGSSTPASAIYLAASQDYTIANNVIHDSLCTVALCSLHGYEEAAPIGTVLAFGGTANNYTSLGDCIHVDNTQRGLITGNTCSGYANGIIVEISKNITTDSNSVHDVFQTFAWDNSRVQITNINALRSTEDLVAGTGVSLATSTATASCAAGCVSAALPPHTSGVILSQTSSSGWDAQSLFTRLAVMMSSSDQPAGMYSLVLSTTTGCTDPNAVTLPFPALRAGIELDQYFFATEHLGAMNFMHSVIGGSQFPGFQTWCVIANDTGASVSSLTLGGLAIQVWSSNNLFTNNTFANSGLNGMNIGGCGSGPVISGNTIKNAGTAGDWAYSYYGYLLGILVASNDPTGCTRSNIVFTANGIAQSSDLSTQGNPYYTPIGLNQGGYYKNDPPINNPMFSNNSFTGSTGYSLFSSTNLHGYLNLWQNNNSLPPATAGH